MNAKIEIPNPKRFLIMFGIWAVSVLASLVAVWGVSAVFGFQFTPSVVIVLSSALFAIGYALRPRKNA